MDFGIVQINAVIDRNDIKRSHFLSLTWFGHNTLHHMFPTLDHGLLPQLNELFLDTCQEFDIQLRELSWWPLIVGQFQQLQRTRKVSLREMRFEKSCRQ
jgi:fatty acid desaturase